MIVAGGDHAPCQEREPVKTTLAEARARMREVELQISADIERRKQIQAAAAPLRKQVELHATRLSKVPVLVERPGNRFMRTTLAGFKSSWLEYAKEIEGLDAIKSPKAQREQIAALLLNGTIKVNLPGEGTSLTVRGVAKRTAVLDRASIRRIEAARAKVAKAQEAVRKALAEQDAVLLEAHMAGDPVESAALAADLATIVTPAALEMLARKASYGLLTEWQVTAMREDAKKHLDHAQSKSKEPCPCTDCTTKRNSRELAARREQEKKAQAKALASLRKVSFTCPTCGQDSVSTVEDGTVKCWNGSCATRWQRPGIRVDAIKVKSMPKSAQPGLAAAGV